jgi:hypothetical protein
MLMSATRARHSRRAFFVHGGAVLGASVATAAGARTAIAPANFADEALTPLLLHEQLSALKDREAIGQLHLAFISLIENERYEEVAELFDDEAHLDLSGMTATGKPAIIALMRRYREDDVPLVHRSYRRSALQQQADRVTLQKDRLRAAASFLTDVELCALLRADCTVARMARLQGLTAMRHWERGCFEASYLKDLGQWKIESLIYLVSLTRADSDPGVSIAS